MNIAIIPARGGSKRIPRKNIRAFAGKPMIQYAIDAARDSGLFDKIVVSTDDEEIASIARQAGADVPFMRPANLADDHTPTVPVISHAIDFCKQQGWPIEAVCCIYPGVPLLEAESIREAYALLTPGGCHYVFPVLAFESPIQRALKRTQDGATQPFDPRFVSTRTQDLEPAYHDAGQFYWGHRQAWEQGLSLHLHARTIVLPDHAALDIDTPADWKRAEALYRVWQENRA